MPPHVLRLKIGAQVVLLRNISVERGLCNRTRLTVKRFGTDLIEFTVNNPSSRPPETVFLHRMLLTPTGKGADSAGFKRRQYPIRLAYACTINKSQGQTLSRCGLVLHSAVFSHGQLYVAMSRVQQAEDFRVWHTIRRNSPEYDILPQGGILIRNVVYNEVFEDATKVLSPSTPSSRIEPLQFCVLLPKATTRSKNRTVAPCPRFPSRWRRCIPKRRRSPTPAHPRPRTPRTDLPYQLLRLQLEKERIPPVSNDVSTPFDLPTHALSTKIKARHCRDADWCSIRLCFRMASFMLPCLECKVQRTSVCGTPSEDNLRHEKAVWIPD